MLMEISHQIASTLGAILILIGYFGLRTRRIAESSKAFFYLNLIGGLLLLDAAVMTRQIGFILLEGAWVVVTVYGAFQKN